MPRPEVGALAVNVLKRLGMGGDLPQQTDEYVTVRGNAGENVPWHRDVAGVALAQPTTKPQTSDLSAYPSMSSAWSSITKDYPAAAASKVQPMSWLQRARTVLPNVLAGGEWGAADAFAEGNNIYFNPSISRRSPEEQRKVLLHEAMHNQQIRNFPTQAWATRANYKPGQYLSSIGESQAFQAEYQDEGKPRRK